VIALGGRPQLVGAVDPAEPGVPEPPNGARARWRRITELTETIPLRSRRATAIERFRFPANTVPLARKAASQPHRFVQVVPSHHQGGAKVSSVTAWLSPARRRHHRADERAPDAGRPPTTGRLPRAGAAMCAHDLDLVRHVIAP
jgi:hypothetical protein